MTGLDCQNQPFKRLKGLAPIGTLMVIPLKKVTIFQNDVNDAVL